MNIWKQAPPIHPIDHIAFRMPEVMVLPNGIRVYVVQGGAQEILKVEWIFKAGRWYEDAPSVARATAKLLTEGTAHRTGKEIAETVEYYGAELYASAGWDTASLQLYTLSKYVQELLPIVQEILTEPAFTAHDLSVFVKKNLHQLQIDAEKTDSIAYKEITAQLFGSQHPYGYNSTAENYQQLTPAMLRSHFERYYLCSDTTIIVSGLVTPLVIEALTACFGSVALRPAQQKTHLAASVEAPHYTHLPKPSAVQSAIRIGKPLFAKHDAQFPSFWILNTALGGYFGSRLMTNLREDKGLTYGIYSTVDAFAQGGCFYIAAEVNKENVSLALAEIRNELEALINTPVGEEELHVLKSYLMGSLLMSLDGAMNISEVVKNSVIHGLPLTYFEELVSSIREITPEQLQALASEHLQPHQLITVVAG